MSAWSLLAVALYVIFLFCVGIGSYRKGQTASDFILGGRKMNFWLTALAAHASDMSSWLFLAYPAVIFSQGLINLWLAVGLVLFMFLNWQFVAPRIRKTTEKYNSLTLSSFFESRFADTTGLIRVFTALATFVFYTIYIAAGLVGLGLLTESLFGISYILGISIGVLIIIPYLFIGGYVTLAWTDLFQGIFLLCVILFVPLYALGYVGGIQEVQLAMQKDSLTPFIPTWSVKNLFIILFTACGWGLGYFGQPHIVTKFMGISQVEDIPKSKYVGITWQILALFGATLVGLVGMALFKGGIEDTQRVFVNMALDLFPPFIAAFMLCAILGVTITSIDSQILVVISNMAEDFYKKLFRKNASSREILIVSRCSIFIVAALSYGIACASSSSIFFLVSYAWFGLGASFGPLVLFSLYSKKTNRYGAWAGVLAGGVTAGVWPIFNRYISIEVPTLIPGFILSSFSIWVVSMITQRKEDSLADPLH